MAFLGPSSRAGAVIAKLPIVISSHGSDARAAWLIAAVGAAVVSPSQGASLFLSRRRLLPEVDAMQRCGALVALLLLALPFFFYGRNGHGSVGVGREGTGTGVQDRQFWAGRLTIRRMAAARKTSMLGERS